MQITYTFSLQGGALGPYGPMTRVVGTHPYSYLNNKFKQKPFQLKQDINLICQMFP